jgi:hypothetical protein
MATIQKNVGTTRTVSGVQKIRKVVSVALVVDDAGLYSVVISYQEYEIDGSANVVGSVATLTRTIADASLPAAAKSEIDSIYARALNAI